MNESVKKKDVQYFAENKQPLIFVLYTKRRNLSKKYIIDRKKQICTFLAQTA